MMGGRDVKAKGRLERWEGRGEKGELRARWQKSDNVSAWQCDRDHLLTAARTSKIFARG